jgi:branched-subunit amino acid aminotransferase/4-amino-4-deoxychorismate lyase
MTALIETVRVRNGVAPLWPLHRDRLARASHALGLALPPLTPPEGGADRIVRMEVGTEGVRVTVRALTVPSALALMVSPTPHRGYPWKTTDRETLEAARGDAIAGGADDALLLADGGSVAEASRWAVVWREPDGQVCAPPLSLGILDSVARRRLHQLVPDGLLARPIAISELRRRPVAVLNAARGLVAVRAIGAAPLDPWPGLNALAARFWP